MDSKRSKSLFDDIFRLQNTAPDDDVDPEDPEDGAKAQLTEGAVDEGEAVGPSSLRKQTAIIADDPKYKGRKASRKDLYSDGEEEEELSSDAESGSGEAPTAGYGDFEDMDDDHDEDDDDDESPEEAGSGAGSDDDGDDDDGMGEDAENEMDVSGQEDVKVLPETSSDDRKKGKAVVFQLGVWDDLIKSRISLQKLVTACNRLPQADVWTDFLANPGFRQEAKNVHSSVRKLVSALVDLQSALSTEDTGKGSSKEKMSGDSSDEEITSESEGEGENEQKATTNGREKAGDDDDASDDGDEDDSEGDEDEDDMSGNDEDNDESHEAGQRKEQQAESSSQRSHLKRKLSAENVEETLAKRHADFQKFRNDTLSKWDEKTRLAHGKIKSKNFAAFEMSVLKQIEQVLVNRDRLVRRIHQKRSDYRILGKSKDSGAAENNNKDVVIEDDDDDVELKLKQRNKSEIAVDPEIIDDNDFYHVCLRDLIEMKQSEETDPVTASKQWLEIQRLRNKQKQKVDTKASKGRKIRYNIKEKLKNYMTPYDKSLWSDEQKDDLFKAMFGGSSSKPSGGETSSGVGQTRQTQELSFILGI
ncbi:protein AATF-like [Elysia marginata]|uniref:Protein AATF-like n=1 Tax=Elysia marginata TaxID=1093978 RepID=A0AAV4G9V8_9GAST|nr:protein AATF-like [Elysia marginata]